MEYHRTPPIVRDVMLDPKELTAHPPLGAGTTKGSFVQIAWPQRRLRELVRACAGHERSVSPHRGARRCGCQRLLERAFEACANAPGDYRELVEDIGGGVSVASIPLALVQVARQAGFTALCQLMYEFCGIYALHHPTPATRLVLSRLMAAGQADAAPKDVCAFSEEDGSKVGSFDASGNEAAWTPCRDRSGNMTCLWKRPQLIGAERLRCALGSMKRLHGLGAAREAARYACDGSASPLETKMVLLLCLPPERGGEGWPFPQLNRRISYSLSARGLAGASCCVADLSWSGKGIDLEVSGKAYHSDERGFELATNRRAALQAMGYNALSQSNDMMRDEGKLEAVVSTLSDLLDFPLQGRSRSFLNARRRLMDELFS